MPLVLAVCGGIACLAVLLRGAFALDRVARGQQELQVELQRGREASLRDLARATEGIRGEISGAQRILAEVRALEQSRTRQLDQAADSLRRLEAVVAGSTSRGAAGENILARALAQLPPDMLERDAAFGNRRVEYALRLPGGRLLPIDSKWTSVASLERLCDAEDAVERKRLQEQVVREVRLKAREVARYLDPERTLCLGILSVPDAVHAAAADAHAEAHRDGVLVVPYSLTLPFVLAVYRLSLRFGGVDSESVASRVRLLDDALRRIEEETEGRLSRGLVQVQNARDGLREQVSDARRETHRLLQAAEAPAQPAAPAELLAPAVARSADVVGDRATIDR
jgi:DNA recombination protein RmuC